MGQVESDVRGRQGLSSDVLLKEGGEDGAVLVSLLEGRFKTKSVRVVPKAICKGLGSCLWLLHENGRVYSWDLESNSITSMWEKRSNEKESSIKIPFELSTLNGGQGHLWTGLSTDGRVIVCGELPPGDAWQDKAATFSAETLRIPTDSKICEVACGVRHGLVLDTTGTLYSWGGMDNGRLGREDTGSPWRQPHPLDSFVRSKVRIVQCCAGSHHSLALSGDCRVFTWGSGLHGKLGHGTEQSEYLPREIEVLKVVSRDDEEDFREEMEDGVDGEKEGSLRQVKSHAPINWIAAGEQHSALVSSAGYLFTFGLNADLQLGHLQKSQPEQGEDLSQVDDGDLIPVPNETRPRLVEYLSKEGIFVRSCVCGETFTLVQTSSDKVVVTGSLPRDKRTGMAQKRPRFLTLHELESKLHLVSPVALATKLQPEDSIRVRATETNSANQIVSQQKEDDSSLHHSLTFHPMPAVKPLSHFLSTHSKVQKEENRMEKEVEKSCCKCCPYHKQYTTMLHNSSLYLENHPEIADLQSSGAIMQCPACCEELIVSLSRQLKEEKKEIKRLSHKLELERSDASSFRELCFRKENTETAVKMILTKLDSLELHSNTMHSFANLLRETVEGLHARVLQLEGVNQGLQQERDLLSARLDSVMLTSTDVSRKASKP